MSMTKIQLSKKAKQQFPDGSPCLPRSRERRSMSYLRHFKPDTLRLKIA